MRLARSLLIAAALTAAPMTAMAQDAADCMSPTATPTGTVERTTVTSRGRELQGLLYRPARPNGAGIVILHDREGIQRDIERYSTQIRRLVTCGYTVIAPSYYDAVNPRAVNDPMMRDKWLQAIDESIVKLAGIEGVDANRIGVWGHGRGGSLALANAMNGIAARAVVVVSAGARAERGRGSPPLLLIAGDRNPAAPLHAAEQLAVTLRERDIDVTVESVPATLPEFEPATWDAVFEKTRAYFDLRLAPTS
ncbi:MAG: dienelactone hydrolase family protein [Brevundimonas sp.]|uniref:dienelactone hydrolase family protein n=1 Tax=Brevundimonas sp. TaxID=1871086 RepID=UPI003918C569